MQKIQSFDWLHFKFKFQMFKFRTNFFVCRFLLQNVFLKLVNIFVFFVFILVDAFSGSFKTEKLQKIFLPWQKMISAKENFRALAWTLAKFYLRERNGQSRAGSIAPSCPLGQPIRKQNSPHTARSRSLPYNKREYYLVSLMAYQYGVIVVLLN